MTDIEIRSLLKDKTIVRGTDTRVGHFYILVEDTCGASTFCGNLYVAGQSDLVNLTTQDYRLKYPNHLYREVKNVKLTLSD